MRMKLNKLWPLLFGVVGMGLFAPAFSDQCQRGCASRPEADAQKTNREMYQHGMYREITPAAGPVIVDGVNLFFQVEPLYWKAVKDGASYAYHGLKTEDTTTREYQPAPLGRVELLKSVWAPGVTVGVGAHLGHDGWDVNLRYTYFQPKRSNQEVALPVFFGITFPTNFTASIGRGTYGTGAEASWRFKFNVLDLEIGRSGRLSPCLVVRPYMGVKATWQRDNNNLTYHRDSASLGGFLLRYRGSSKQVEGPGYIDCSYNVLGVGLRGGCGFSWFLCNCFNIYGDFSWSVLWTDYYDQHRVDTVHDDGPPVADVIVGNLSTKHTHNAKSLCEFECGLSWETWFCCESYYFEVRLGWKEQVWVNWVRDFQLSGTYKNLSLYGPKASLRFGF